ncbi:hypothetical protein JCM10207_008983 [Rhodosporidiobolus poonsookiae]
MSRQLLAQMQQGLDPDLSRPAEEQEIPGQPRPVGRAGAYFNPPYPSEGESLYPFMTEEEIEADKKKGQETIDELRRMGVGEEGWSWEALVGQGGPLADRAKKALEMEKKHKEEMAAMLKEIEEQEKKRQSEQ